MATPISRDDRRAVSCSGLRPSQLTAAKTYTTPGDITEAALTAAKAEVPTPSSQRPGARPLLSLNDRRQTAASQWLLTVTQET